MTTRRIGNHRYNTDINLHSLAEDKKKPANHELASRYNVRCKSLKEDMYENINAKFIMVTTGILGEQYNAEDRGLKDVREFKGVFTLAGKHHNQQSLIGAADCTDKVVRHISPAAAKRCGMPFILQAKYMLLLSLQ